MHSENAQIIRVEIMNYYEFEDTNVIHVLPDCRNRSSFSSSLEPPLSWLLKSSITLFHGLLSLQLTTLLLFFFLLADRHPLFSYCFYTPLSPSCILFQPAVTQVLLHMSSFQPVTYSPSLFLCVLIQNQESNNLFG